MPRAHLLRLGLRLLARDWRAGELRLLGFALVIAVGAVTAVGFFTERLSRGMTAQSAELLGADLLLASPQPVEADWIAEAQGRRLRTAPALEFASVAVHGEQLQLSNVRAVGTGYPLRGALRTAPAPYAPETPAGGIPAPGTAWVEARLLQQLSTAVGGRLEIGRSAFTITRVLTHEPGRGAAFFLLAPRVLINVADVPATGVIQPGSRVTYQLALAGGEADVSAYREWLAPRLDRHQQLLDARGGNATLGRALERVDRYLGLTSLLAVLLAGVAVAMGARRYSARHFDLSAMLRCFGAAEREILWLMAPSLAVLGMVASLAGGLLGWLGQEAIHALLEDVFPVKLPAPGPAPLLLGFVTGLVMLAGFAAPPLLRLKRVPPLRVLRRELAPLPAGALAVYGSATVAMLLLMWRYTGSWTLTASVLLGALVVAAVLGAAAYGLLRAGRRLGTRVGVAWRFGFNNLWRRASASVGQLTAFGVTLMAMALILLVRTDLLSTWQAQLPVDTPNHFAFNVLADDVPAFERFIGGHRIAAQALYPLVRGRLTAINAAPVVQAVTKEENNNEALNRELNLTWSNKLPPDNQIVRGEWHASNTGRVVSVEERLARRLGVQIGDALTFSIGGMELEARVTSLRKVQWDSFHPNFYMIFPAGVLDDFPATWLTSFHLAPAQKPLLTELVRRFPSVSVLETDQVLAQVRSILRQVTAAVEFVLLFVLAAGLAVLGAALAASRDERLHEGALLRALGASRRQLRAGHLAEFAALGFAAGLLAAAGTELIAFVLYTRVFELEYALKWPVWLLAPLAGAAIIAVAGYLGTARVLRQSPLTVLREA
jgi:putative ABC transport system permease protein